MVVVRFLEEGYVGEWGRDDGCAGVNAEWDTEGIWAYEGV